MRTQDEIIERVKQVDQDGLDWLGTQIEDLLGALTNDSLRKIPDIVDLTKVTDERKVTYSDDATIRSAIVEYLPFAFDKCMSHRGISAGRSIDHLSAWVWLLGDSDYDQIDWESYTNYGAPILKQVAEMYGLDVPDDDGFRRMARGMSCGSGYECGCG